jgi:uncharacterized sulfatase
MNDQIKIAFLKFVMVFITLIFVGCKSDNDTIENIDNEPLQVLGHDRDALDKPNIIIIYTDDHGYADMGAQGVLSDLKTPNVDALVATGIRATNGYSTAPQCVPSRGGLLAGRFQGKFGLDSNGDKNENPQILEAENILPERLKKAGYVTAQFGKWHVGESIDIVKNGFDHVYPQNSAGNFPSNIDMEGNDRILQNYAPEGYHLETCSKAASSIIKRYKDSPFFLYVAFRAPHVPLDATQKYIDRFPGEMPERRRKALAMISAVDDGVGLIVKTLEDEKILDNTLIFYISDNGAPYKKFKTDDPGNGAGWNGSLNDPMNGEKGTLIEGGIHVPYVISWKGVLPEGVEYNQPISTLDVAATAVDLAQLSDKSNLDGVNLIPYLTGVDSTPPHESLTWRWESQNAIRKGDWKLIVNGNDEYLYNLDIDISETNNLISQNPIIASELKNELAKWSQSLIPAGLYSTPSSAATTGFFEFYLN